MTRALSSNPHQPCPLLIMFSHMPPYLLFLIFLILGAEGKGGGGAGGESGGSTSKNKFKYKPKSKSGSATRIYTSSRYPDIIFVRSGKRQYCRDRTTWEHLHSFQEHL